MAIYGIETGAFEQAGDGFTNPDGTFDPQTGLPANIPFVNDSAFEESDHYARNATSVSSRWWFPTRFTSFGNFLIIGCVKSGSGYQDGTWVNKPFNTALLTNLGDGSYLFNDPNAGVYIYNFNPAKWTQLTNLQFAGQSDPTTTWFVAKWGANAFTVQPAGAVISGRYSMQMGLLSHYNYNRGLPSVVDAWNSIGGSIQYRMVSADFTQDIDVTPIGKGGSNFVTGPVGNGVYPYPSVLDSLGNDIAGISSNITLDSRVIFGRNIPFFPKTVYSDIPDPGIASSGALGNNYSNCAYGALWTSSETLP